MWRIASGAHWNMVIRSLSQPNSFRVPVPAPRTVFLRLGVTFRLLAQAAPCSTVSIGFIGRSQVAAVGFIPNEAFLVYVTQIAFADRSFPEICFHVLFSRSMFADSSGESRDNSRHRSEPCVMHWELTMFDIGR